MLLNPFISCRVLCIWAFIVLIQPLHKALCPRNIMTIENFTAVAFSPGMVDRLRPTVAPSFLSSCPSRDRPPVRVWELILKSHYYDERMFHSANHLAHVFIRSVKTGCRIVAEFVGRIFEILATVC